MDIKELITGKGTGSRSGEHATITQFPPLDTARIADKLDLTNTSKPRSPREIGELIREDLDTRVTKAFGSYQSQMQSIDSRIRSVIPSLRAGAEITSMVDVELAMYQAEESVPPAHLTLAGERAESCERELRDFRELHELSRPNLHPKQPDYVMATLLVVAAVMFESGANALLFAEGSSKGLIGGVMVAAALALVSAVIGALDGVAVRYLAYRGPQRIIAMAALPVLMIVGAGYALLIGHIRDAYVETAGAPDLSAVWTHFRSDPFGLGAMDAWFLAALSLGVQALSAFKVWTIDDPYPGYGRRARARDEAQLAHSAAIQAYADKRAQRTHDVVAHITHHLDVLQTSLYDSTLALEQRPRLHSAFEAYLAHIPVVHRRLWEKARDARSGEGPEWAVPDYEVPPAPILMPAPEFNRAAIEDQKLHAEEESARLTARHHEFTQSLARFGRGP